MNFIQKQQYNYKEKEKGKKKIQHDPPPLPDTFLSPLVLQPNSRKAFYDLTDKRGKINKFRTLETRKEGSNIYQLASR